MIEASDDSGNTIDVADKTSQEQDNDLADHDHPIPLSNDSHTFGYSGTTDIGTPLENRMLATWGEADSGAGTAEYIMALLGSNSGSYTGKVTAGLYEYVDWGTDYAGTLVAQTEVKTITITSMTPQWMQFNFTGTQPLINNNTRYYLAVSGESNGAGTDYDITVMAQSSAPGYSVVENLVYSDTLEDPWVGEGASSYRRALYCAYTIMENQIPIIENENPPNMSINIKTWPTCSVTVNDYDDDSLTVEFYENTTGSWKLQQTNSTIMNNTKVVWGNYSNASSYNTRYFWRVCVFDGTIWVNETFNFLTGTKYVISLQDGWNIISAQCYDFIAKTDVTVRNNSIDRTWDQAVENGTLLGFMYNYDRVTQSYDFSDGFAPGYGYWVWAYYDCALIFSSGENGAGHITDLQDSWAIMGMPYNSTIVKASVNVTNNSIEYTWDDAVSAGIILGFVYGWDSTSQLYALCDSFVPGRGYWMYSYYDCVLKKGGY